MPDIPQGFWKMAPRGRRRVSTSQARDLMKPLSMELEVSDKNSIAPVQMSQEINILIRLSDTMVHL